MTSAEPGPGKKTVALEDDELLRRCRQGDAEAFGALVEKYQSRIYNLIFRMVGRAADAEELAQETFLKALQRLEQFRGQSRFYTWLFRIAANLALSHRRRRGLIRFHSLSGSAEDDGSDDPPRPGAAGLEGPDPGPDQGAATAEIRRRVLRAIGELEGDCRLVVVLRDMEGMDYAGIAEILDVPVGTVKSKLHRARWLLRAKLADLMD